MENYLMLNGRKIEITNKQTDEIIKALADIPVKESLFKQKPNQRYYTISGSGLVCITSDFACPEDIQCHENANYCSDKALMEQRAFYEKVERNLWRFSMENGGSGNWLLYYNKEADEWSYFKLLNKYFGPTFKTKEIAERAIKEVLIPLIAKSKYQSCDLLEWSI